MQRKPVGFLGIRTRIQTLRGARGRSDRAAAAMASGGVVWREGWGEAGSVGVSPSVEWCRVVRSVSVWA